MRKNLSISLWFQSFFKIGQRRCCFLIQRGKKVPLPYYWAQVIIKLQWLERDADCSKVREDVARLIYFTRTSMNFNLSRHFTVKKTKIPLLSACEALLLIYSLGGLYGCNIFGTRSIKTRKNWPIFFQLFIKLPNSVTMPL